MPIDFNADEIFEMAEQIERNGAAFYRRAAETQAKAEAKDLLLQLASWEVEHEKTFAAMREQLTDAERASDVFDPDGLAGSYLRAMTANKVFDPKAEPAKRLTGKEKLSDILRTAIGLERDSIVFYVGMQEAVPEHLGRGKITRIIREEMNHVTILSEQLARAE
jgi:rubrerythrin